MSEPELLEEPTFHMQRIAEYQRQYRKEHPEKLREYQRRYRKKYPEKYLALDRECQKRQRQRFKSEIFALLGGKCTICGYVGTALQIDHINGCGKKEVAKARAQYYRLVLKSIKNDEKKYQLLCANCNWEKKFRRNEK